MQFYKQPSKDLHTTIDVQVFVSCCDEVTENPVRLVWGANFNSDTLLHVNTEAPEALWPPTADKHQSLLCSGDVLEKTAVVKVIYLPVLQAGTKEQC